MLIQSLCDCTVTVTDPPDTRTRVLGPGELLTLPSYLALKVLCQEPEHFKILKPTPLIPGVAVRWLTLDDREQGPGIVQVVDGYPPDRRFSVLVDGELRWIQERDIFDIDVWPAINAKLEAAWPYLAIDGEESPQVIAVRDWVLAHFDED